MQHKLQSDLENADFTDTAKLFSTPNGRVFGWGTSVPSAVAGWAPGALFIDTDAAAGQQQWVNEGTITSCTFKRKEAGNISMLAAEVIALAATAHIDLAGTAYMGLEDDAYIEFGTGNDVRISWNGTYLQSGLVTDLWANAPSEMDPNPAVKHSYFNDFRHLTLDYDATNDWTMTEDDAACTQAISADAVNGTLLLTNKATTDNNGQQIELQQESFKLAAGKPLWFEVRIKCAAGATEIDWAVGLIESEDLTGVADNMPANGIVFHKDDDDTNIDISSTDNTTNLQTAAVATATTGWVRLGFYFDGGATGAATITPYVDGVAGTPIAAVTYVTMAELAVAFMVRNGDNVTTQTMEIDYVKVVQLR